MPPRVGLAFDPEHTGHRSPGHPERPERLEAVVARLQPAGLWEQLHPLPLVEATPEQLQAVHAPELLATVRRLTERGGGWLDPDTYVTRQSWEIAARAAGTTAAAAEATALGEVESALCLLRPPGHHATRTRAMGFCLVNHVAVAAYHLRRRGAQRAAVVDFDVHHGNGTQEVFWSDPDLLYFSVHQYPLYPGTGHWSEVGAGPGKGATINVPLPPGSGDAQYGGAFQRILDPALRRFQPQIVLVSAGFDAHHLDPLAQQEVSSAGFGRLMALLRDLAVQLCGGKLLVLLEGGYDLDGLAESVCLCTEVLLGGSSPPPPKDAPATGPDVNDLLERIRALHGL